MAGRLSEKQRDREAVNCKGLSLTRQSMYGRSGAQMREGEIVRERMSSSRQSMEGKRKRPLDQCEDQESVTSKGR